MKHLKFAIAGLAALGLISLFLPLTEGANLTLWDARPAEALWVYLPLGGYGAAAAIALLASVQGAMIRWQGAVATVGFALAFGSEPVRRGMASGGGVGAKLLFVTAVLGAVVSIAATIKPEETH